MPDIVWTAIIGGVAGIVTGSVSSLVAPWANWRIERRKEKLAYRKEQTLKWRQMLSQAATSEVKNDDDVIRFLERHHDYYSLKPYIRGVLPTGKPRARISIAGSPDLTIPELLNDLIEAVGKIEIEWELA
jgi:hypothetical protein